MSAQSLEFETVGDAREHIRRRLCRWCWTPLYRTHDAFDEAEATRLADGGTEGVLRAKGHRIDADGEVEVASASRSAAPEAIRADDAPPTVVDGGRRHGGTVTFCGKCGNGDAPPAWRSMSRRERYEALERMADHLDGIDAAGVDRGRRAIQVANRDSARSGDDLAVLGEALFVAVGAYR